MLYSRGFEDPENEEDAEDEQDEDTEDEEDEDIAEDATSDETPLQRGTICQSKRDPVKKVLTVDEKCYPYGSMKKAYEEDLRLISKDLDPCYNFKQQTQAMKERFMNRMAAGMTFLLVFKVDLDV